MRIGIFGGTFDPPHLGHLTLARAAMSQLELDELLFLPANRNPLKSAHSQTPGRQRLAMVDLLVRNEPNMGYSDMELTRGGSSYTVDTLGELQMVRPAEYWFLMGADALRGLSNWKNPIRLMKLCRLGVAVRPPLIVDDVLVKLPEDFRGKVDIVNIPAQDISSSEIRMRIQGGQDVSPGITPEVLQYIRANKLYRDA